MLLGSAQGEIISYELTHDLVSGQYQMDRSGCAFTGGVPVVQVATDSSGGVYASLSTGRIILYRRDDSGGLNIEDTFHLEIKCTGAKIEGVVPAEQYAVLLHAQTDLNSLPQT